MIPNKSKTDDPQFQALDADMKKRKKERLERHHQAMRCKDDGNKLLQAGEYTKAIEMYGNGLEYQKGIFSLFCSTNIRRSFPTVDCQNFPDFFWTLEIAR